MNALQSLFDVFRPAPLEEGLVVIYCSQLTDPSLRTIYKKWKKSKHAKEHVATLYLTVWQIVWNTQDKRLEICT